MRQMILGIFTIKMEAEPTDDLEGVGIITEGVEVLHDLGNIANVVAMLFGLLYSLTFEVLQTIVMELDGNCLSTKAQELKQKQEMMSGYVLADFQIFNMRFSFYVGEGRGTFWVLMELHC
uniref:Uncharacterized protein n=1 Tax=Pundamilia nyererei TaxID=303518 RepID=A0A3B4F4K3_9CICH